MMVQARLNSFQVNKIKSSNGGSVLTGKDHDLQIP